MSQAADQNNYPKTYEEWLILVIDEVIELNPSIIYKAISNLEERGVIE